MSCDRFDAILSVLPMEYLRTDKNRSRPIKIGCTVYDKLLRNCLEYGKLQESVSLDERMVRAKSRFAFRHVKVSKIYAEQLLNMILLLLGNTSKTNPSSRV